MNFMDYNNKTSANIITGEGFQELTRNTFETISDVMIKSLGPLGSTTTILDGVYTSATKDGFAIFKDLTFTNRYKAMIYNLIKAPCTKLNNTVGDGTTTAIVLTQHLFNQFNSNNESLKKLYRLPRQFTSTWDEVINEMVELVGSFARPLGDPGHWKGEAAKEHIATVYDIAKVSSNGNEEISRNIENIYSQSTAPVIKLQNSPTNKCYFEALHGFSFPTNLIDTVYVQNEDLTTDLTNLKALIFHYKVDTDAFEKIIRPLNEVYKSHGEKLLVIAPAYDELLANTVLKAYVNAEAVSKKINLVLTQYLYGKLTPSQAEDLAAVLDCRLLDIDTSRSITEKLVTLSDGELYDYLTEDYERSSLDERSVIGSIPSAHLTVNDGAIFSNFNLADNQIYQRQLKQAEKTLSNLLASTDADKKNYSMDIAKAKARIAQLRMESYIYYIGSDSSLQTKVIWDTVDDVIKATHSSVKYGTVPGCQISIIRACQKMKCKRPNDYPDNRWKLKKAIIQLIEDAVHDLYRSVITGPNGDGVDRIKEEIGDAEMVKLVGYAADSDKYADMTRSIENLNDGRDIAMEIIRCSVSYYQVFDIESMTYNSKIVTSVETDINVLLAASELVKLLISGNQCIYLDNVLINSEDVGI